MSFDFVFMNKIYVAVSRKCLKNETDRWGTKSIQIPPMSNISIWMQRLTITALRHVRQEVLVFWGFFLHHCGENLCFILLGKPSSIPQGYKGPLMDLQFQKPP